ncbi:toll/interleukin-1 receptor domain-containing protein [Actinomadura rubrisoli]|uniref:Toll/interleukin-1 receptor domain-containing protein n=1 Tax=Actinomadura rubrisoli TaxID=2530368 RepID=A0A4R5C2S7_9ACTN|nr:toll/interleukin-1 receptor domain-containing protein [Actinomadura rubrisoli]TDD93938.1 toll/interleukin-1 receptor domain-containing protein [Actinomadura rubrisoli]
MDAKGYGGATDRGQEKIQDGLLQVLDEAAGRAGLRRRGWTRQPGGDGELAILPDTEPEPRVVEDFPRALAAALHARNRDLRPGLRLRLAVHHGMTFTASNGYAGAGPVAVSRLCDSPVLKDALAASGADLAVIYSRQVFADTIRQEHTGLRPGELREVRVAQKEFDEPAWIWIPGHDVHALTLPEPDPEPEPEPEPEAEPEPVAGSGRPGLDHAAGIDAVICFAEQDVAAVERLAMKLRRKGVSIWIEPWVDPGLVVLLEKERAIGRAANGILVFSRAAMAQSGVMDDYAALLTRVHETGGRRFVPVLIEDVPLPRFAALRRALDLTGDRADEESRIDLLAHTIRSDTPS